MIPELIAIAHLYAHDDRTLDRLVGDLSEADWKRQDGAGHTLRWIVGHLGATRLRMLEIAGLPPMTAPWTAAFGRGTSDADVPDSLDMKAVVAAFHEAHQRLAARWEHLSAEDLAKPLGRTLPDGTDTVGGALRFLVWHEAYHFGQLGLLRRLAGKGGLA